jgi:osmoprotectant transport system substrate-binding protein
MARTALWLLLSLVLAVAPARAETVTVGSKNFTEQFVVAEIYAGALEAEGFTVRRRINLGATLVAHEALKAGAIDLYPEYTGTGLLAVMKADSDSDPERVLAKVRAHYEKEFGLTWLTPSRVNNGNAMLVRKDTAERYGLKTLSDLAAAAPKLKLGGGSEFFDRYDGVPGLKAVYGIVFGESRQFAALRLRYDALGGGQADVTNGFTTDWQIAAGKFVVLDDDKHLFPPYYLAPVVRMEVARNPRLVAALDRVNARLDTATMQELNRQVEVDKKEPRKVAAAFLEAQGLVKRP